MAMANKDNETSFKVHATFAKSRATRQNSIGTDQKTPIRGQNGGMSMDVCQSTSTLPVRRGVPSTGAYNFSQPKW